MQPERVTGAPSLALLALELRAELLAHPGSVHLLLAGSLDGPNARAVNETLLTILSGAGLDPDDAARAAHLLNVHVLGSVALEVAGPDGLDTDGEAARFRWGLDRVLEGLAAHGGHP